MIVRIGDVVRLRDGRRVAVTDAVDQTSPEVIESPDDICLGNVLNGIDGYRAVFPMSEVIAILE